MLQSNERIIRHKVGLLNLAEELGNVSKACQIMGLSRDTFYRYRDAVEEGGVEALLERNRRVPNRKNRPTARSSNELLERGAIENTVESPREEGICPSRNCPGRNRPAHGSQDTGRAS